MLNSSRRYLRRRTNDIVNTRKDYNDTTQLKQSSAADEIEQNAMIP